MAAALRPFLALLLAAPASAQLFSTPVYPVNLQALRVVVADLNGDGHADAAVTTGIDDTIVVLHGDGHGAFATVATLSPGAEPVGIAAGDVQGDGMLDLVTARFNKNRVTVQHSLGGAAYATPVQLAVPNSPRDVTLADLDGDGDLDALTANTGAALTTVLRNVGGMLQLVQEAGPAFGAGEVVQAQDLDLDGDLDAVIGSTSSNIVAWLPNDGTGTLGTAAVFSSPGSSGRTLAIADFDEDGWPDIIAPPSIFGSGMPALYSLGGGAFQPVQLLPLLVNAQSVEPADLNGDGHIDLLVGPVDGDILVLLGDGSSTFKAKASLQLPADGLRAVDVDEDGRLDLVALGDGLHVRLGDGFAGFAEPVHVPTKGAAAAGLKAVDVDRDGLKDLVCATTKAGSVLLSQGDGSFVEKPLLGGAASSLGDIGVADLDGNGQLDFVVTTYGGGQLLIYHDDGSLGFSSPTWTLDPGDGFPMHLAVGDLGAGPSGPEIVVTLSPPPAEGSISIVSANGVGGYLKPVSYAAGSQPRSPHLMDLEPDGDLDIVFLQGEPRTLAALRNTGGVFGALETWPIGDIYKTAKSLALGDMDEDGRLDAVTANVGDSSVSVLLGIPGGFGPATSFDSTAGSPSELDLGDLDGDGHLDVAVSCQAGATLAVLRGDGDGALLPAEEYSGSDTGSGVALADFDSDGRLDAAQGEPFFSIAVHLSAAEPTWLNLGHSLAGAGGTPFLEPFGTLEADAQVSLKLSGALANSTGALFLGLTAANLPFKGGTLVPAPDVVLGGLPSGPAGGWTLTGQLPAGLPSGLTLHAQTWIVDAGGPKGLAASNGLVGTTD